MKKFVFSPEELRRQKIQKLRDLAEWYRHAASPVQAAECERYADKLAQMPLEDLETSEPENSGRLF